MPKYTSKKTLRERLAELESALVGLQLRASAATALATIVEKDNIQLKRRIKGLENQLNIQKSYEKKMDDFDKTLKHYEFTSKRKNTEGLDGVRWTTNPRNFDKPFPNWEN